MKIRSTDLSGEWCYDQKHFVTQENVLGTEEEGSINRRLPGEMLEMVFRHLPPKDLKVAVLVCKW